MIKRTHVSPLWGITYGLASIVDGVVAIVSLGQFTTTLRFKVAIACAEKAVKTRG